MEHSPINSAVAWMINKWIWSI